jgi:hypothetical protein
MQEVKIVSVEDDGYYSSAQVSGSTVKVTLQRGEEFATCGNILIWEESMADSDTFDEWAACAKDGEEGYTAMLLQGNKTILYA